MAINTIQLFGNRASGSFIKADNLSYFLVSEGFFNASETSSLLLYRTDGTETGTFSLMNENTADREFFLPTGNLPNDTVTTNDNLLFSGSNYTGSEPSTGSITYPNQELYISDGTLEGTRILKEINPVNDAVREGSDPGNFVAINDLVVFTAFDGGTNGRTLWSTDGTEEGTQQIADVNDVPNVTRNDAENLDNFDPFNDIFGQPDFTDQPVNGNILFQAFDGETTGLWKTDGTSEGTQLIRSFDSVVPGEEVIDLEFVSVAGNNLFFQIENSLWRSDGTAEGTQLIVSEIPEIREESGEKTALGVGDNLFFSTFSELWTSDGTAEGTQTIRESGDFEGSIGSFINADGKLFFVDSEDGRNNDLWRSDGTAEGTQLVFDGDVTDVVEGTNGNVYFISASGNDVDGLWRTDGTEAGTVLIESSDAFDIIDPGGFESFTTLNDRILFTGDTIVEGQSTEALFSVTDETIVDNDDNDDDDGNVIELFRFRNTTFESGTYVFVGEEEKEAILADEDLSNTFSLDGRQNDGTVNPAFKASLEQGDDLIPFYRLKSLDVPGTFLFVSTGEYDAIFDDDSDQQDKWEKEGLDSEGNDIPEFYLLDGSADRGAEFNRFQNTQNGTFLYAGEGETGAIESDPNLSSLFTNQGVAFKSLP